MRCGQETVDSTRLVALTLPATSWRLTHVIYNNLLQMGGLFEVFNLQLLRFWRNGIWGLQLSHALFFYLWTFIFVFCVYYFYLSFNRPFSAWSFSWRLDGRVEHQCWGRLHWGWQWCTEIDLSPHHQFPKSFPTWRIRPERMEVKSYFQNFSFISIFRAFFLLWTGSTQVCVFSSWSFVKVYKVPSHLSNGARSSFPHFCFPF